MGIAVRTMLSIAAFGLALLSVRPSIAQETREDGTARAAWDRVVEAGRQSTDLRVRIVYSLGEIERRDGGDRLSEAIPVETLVEQSRGSTDPIVLSLLVDRCADDLQKAGHCDAVDLARRWTVADTQNQLAWIALSTALATGGDADAARAAFRRAARASQWHEYHPEVARLLESAAPKAGDPRARAAMLLAIWSKALTGLPSGHDLTINRRCKEAELHEACGRILEVMARDAQSVMALSVATGTATARSALPPATIAALQQRLDALQWASLMHLGRYADDPTSPAEAIRAVAFLETLIAGSEIDTLRRSLQNAGLRESDAARRYVAKLNAEQLAYRASPKARSTN